MSRIILQRHANGEEKLTAGYDRPLAYWFAEAYDVEGEWVHGTGPHKVVAPVTAYLLYEGVDAATAASVDLLLREHEHLEYPASNVVVDMSVPA